MMAMMARSRRALMSGTSFCPPPCSAGTSIFQVTGIESSRWRICSASIIGVMPTCWLNLGPLTNVAGLSKLILFGEASLRLALNEYIAHHHFEQNHQGKDNLLLFPSPDLSTKCRTVRCRDRLGG